MDSRELARRAAEPKVTTAKQGPHPTAVPLGVDPETGTVRPAGSASQRIPKAAPLGPAESKTAITDPDGDGDRDRRPPGTGKRMSAAIMKPTRSNPARKF